LGSLITILTSESPNSNNNKLFFEKNQFSRISKIFFKKTSVQKIKKKYIYYNIEYGEYV